jgi:predicted kinase
MKTPVLFLMLGYPGAGKTTAALEIHKASGATHLWADHIRRERFDPPTYTHQENIQLYSHLNELAAELLAAGNSVIFDTNFNFYKDREHLRKIAEAHGARNILVWVTTPKDIARQRAIKDAHQQTTRILGNMPLKDFERMSGNLQPPREGEPYVEIDGTKISTDYIKHELKEYLH